MLRVLDVTRAIEERGYPKNVSCRFTLAVKDMVARANNEKLSVTVEDGRATVRTAKSANIVIDVGTFASVYTGFSNPHALAAVGRIQASLPSLDKLAVCFSGTPTLVDFF